MRERLFTLEEANELVPWLEAAFLRLAPVQESLAGSRSRAAELERVRRGNGTSSQHQESNRVRQEIERLNQRIGEGLQDILDQGIIVRDVGRGLVDFPSIRNGREVYLCWISGEESIEFWHEIDRGFAHREPL